MSKHKFKAGDYVFHHSEKYGTASGKVIQIGSTGCTVKVEFSPNHGDTVWVLASKCQLQSEWADEHEATIER